MASPTNVAEWKSVGRKTARVAVDLDLVVWLLAGFLAGFLAGTDDDHIVIDVEIGVVPIFVLAGNEHPAAVGQGGLRLAEPGEAPGRPIVLVARDAGAERGLLFLAHLLQFVKRRHDFAHGRHVLLAGAIELHARGPGCPLAAHHELPEGYVHALGVGFAKARLPLGKVLRGGEVGF